MLQVTVESSPLFANDASDVSIPGCAPEPEAEFVRKVRGLFLTPACVQASFSATDEKLALGMYRRGVSMEQITRAILLGCARKYVAMISAGVRTPITSLQYFSDIVEEVPVLIRSEMHFAGSNRSLLAGYLPVLNSRGFELSRSLRISDLTVVIDANNHVAIWDSPGYCTTHFMDLLA
ncbi:MAG: hypothetical protein ACYCOX_15890 [Acidobacteriaceae bacterium]